MLTEPDIIQFDLKVKSRSQVIGEAARRLKEEMDNRRFSNPLVKYTAVLDYYHLENAFLILRYQIKEASLNADH